MKSKLAGVAMLIVPFLFAPASGTALWFGLQHQEEQVVIPTIGRVLHYYQPANPIARTSELGGQGQGPFCAIVTCVREDGLLNCAIFGHGGKPLPDPPCGIPLVLDRAVLSQDRRNGWLEVPPREAGPSYSEMEGQSEASSR